MQNPYEAFSFLDWWRTLTPSFVSFPFILFVFFLALLYYVFPLKKRWIVLLFGSACFYLTAGMTGFVMLLLTSSLVWAGGICIGYTQKEYKRKRRFYLFTAITVLLSVLLFAKCHSLFQWKFSYIVPLGLSYYTFSAIGYLADVYWGKEKAERNYFKMALFLLFFPKILQGPIAKHKTLAPQLNEGHAFDYQQFCFGIQLAIWGYFKKMVIADRIAVFTSKVISDHGAYGGAFLLFTFALAAIQLYCDFSGCMDIAGGISQMFGITLEKNFDHPFFSKTAAEFWRRWHITLGTWFKDYVYMPIVINPKLIQLSGRIAKRTNRRMGKNIMTVVPLSVVWILTGLWHGTGWNYFMWGIYWGTIIIFSNVFAPELKKLTKLLRIPANARWWQGFQMVRTFLMFCVGRIITMPSSLKESWDILKTIILQPNVWELVDGTMFNQGLDRIEFALMLIGIALLWNVSIQQTQGSVREKIAGWNMVGRCAFYALSVIVILVFGIYGLGYGNTTFVYMNF